MILALISLNLNIVGEQFLHYAVLILKSELTMISKCSTRVVFHYDIEDLGIITKKVTIHSLCCKIIVILSIIRNQFLGNEIRDLDIQTK